MRHWWQLATRSWRTRSARSALAALAVALGVGVVVWVTCCYESVRRGVTEVVLNWIGRSHVIIEPVEGVWAYFNEDIENVVAGVPGVARTTVWTREFVEVAAATADPDADPFAGRLARIEATGIVPEKELEFRDYDLSDGRFLAPGDEDAVLVESLLADELGVGVGDALAVRHIRPPQPTRLFQIIGVVSRRRASANQPMMIWARLPDVQALCKLPGSIKTVDAILHDAGVENIRGVAERIESAVEEYGKQIEAGGGTASRLKVKTTEAQHKKLGAAQGLLQFIMMLLSCVVLLTAFFIILATMGMGVTEQIAELGLLRCVGATRRQVAALVALQTIPLGVVGVAVGVPLGVLLQWLTIRAAPEYLGELALSRWGTALAVFGGLGTTLLGAAVPAFRASSVSPVEATRPHARAVQLRWVWLTAAAGVVLIAAHELLKRAMSHGDAAAFDAMAVASVLLLYGGYALLAPAAVVALGRAAVWITATVLRLRPQLLGDEIDKAPFRSASICCGLMVGLSLIVGLIVWGGSVKQGWQFPKEFPDALLYSYQSLPLEQCRRAVGDAAGVGQWTVTDDFPFSPTKPGPFRLSIPLLDEFSRFLAIDPDQGLAIVKLTFLEGEAADAVAKLKQGGHLLITREFAAARDKGVGDELTIWIEEKHLGGEPARRGQPVGATFRIAGVVASPGLDIAISFFNATAYFQTYSVGALIGTLDDARRLFGRDYGKLMLFNFDLPEDAAESPADPDGRRAMTFTRRDRPGESQTFAIGAGPIDGDGPEERVANGILARLGYPVKAFVTARELKQLIDRNIDRVTLLLSVIPVVGLVVAALGLANLMAANVASRARHLAVLRAIGVTRSQLARIVIGEALIIGLLGSALGLGLGVYLGHTSNFMTELLSGFQPVFVVPWRMVAAGAGLATLMCVLAALTPAHYAGRSNIVSVLSAGM